MTTPHPAPSTTPAGSVLDGDPRILIPLPEAAERLGISRWQAYKLARSGRLRPPASAPVTCTFRLRCCAASNKKACPRAGGERGRVTRRDLLAAHARRLGNHDLNELLVQLSKPAFAALADVALARPTLPAGLLPRYERANGVDGWMVVACAPRRRLGTLTRDRDPNGHLVWRAWTRAGDPVQVAGVWCWARRGDAAAALAWVTPASGARFMALAAHVRGLADPELHELLRSLPCAVFDGLLEAAYRPEGTAA